MAKHSPRESGVEVAPLLIIGLLTLLALSLWLWRGSELQTSARTPALAMQAPGGSGQPRAPKPAAPAAPTEPQLQVPTLPAGVVGEHWQTSSLGGAPHAALRRPDGSELGLTISPKVQRRIKRRMERVRVPYGAVVLMDVQTGAVKAWVEHQEAGEVAGEGHGLTRATAPAASVFKIVTAAALLEAGATPQTETCFHGGHRRITAKLLTNSPSDVRCESLAMALAKSSNVAFAKQAVARLSAGGLTATAEDLFFGRALPFDVQTSPSWVRVANHKLGLARAAAGFVGTSLSPLHGAALAAAVANDGLLARPYLVDTDSLQPGLRREPRVVGRVMSGAIARDLREMMALTMTDGTGRRQFSTWPKSLAHIQVAGKTGTLAKKVDGVYRHYTWFVGFAPADQPRVAVAALAVNGKRWRTRGPSLARHALASWFLVGERQEQAPPKAAATAAPAKKNAAPTKK